MPLGREVGLGPGDIVLDGEPVRPQGAQPPRGTAALNFRTMSIAAKRLYVSGYHLIIYAMLSDVNPHYLVQG